MGTILETPLEQQTRYPVIDSDVHPDFNYTKPELLALLPQRWRDYAAEYGARPGSPGGDRPRQREFAHRWDAEPTEGAQPGSNVDFAREQLLDKYDYSAAMVNDIGAYNFSGGRGMPRQFAAAMISALNDYREAYWFTNDPRWYGSMNLPYEVPSLAVKEVQRRMDGDFRDRWRQILMPQDNLFPLGNEQYWPIYEIAEEYGLPIGLHVLSSNRQTPSGSTNYYFEEHCDFAAMNFPTVSSLVFEGVFDRFPKLKIALIEFAWSWAMPFSWRLDAAYDLMRSEVAHLQRRPSEYVRDHIWYSTQPMEEPERGEWVDDVFGTLEASGMSDKIMFSSDYPHWDFDDPGALPTGLPDRERRRILGENASALYGIPLKAGTGVTLP